MRQAFTLIELMIVIAIIAIIAAIAVPNLLESRINANESAAAASLKSGLFAAQVQFQAGGYIDPINDPEANGVGSYAEHHADLAGATAGAATQTSATSPVTPLQLMGPEWNFDDGSDINGFAFYVYCDTTNDSNSERYWFATAAPTTWGDTGRRSFAITQSGSVYSVVPAVNTDNTIALALNADDPAAIITTNILVMSDPALTDPTQGGATNGTAGVGYRK